ncbi:MAG: hypothetical protein JWR16_1832 [Nevskia sp.]|nr:hypothetical protein [Nevskia sp.]
MNAAQLIEALGLPPSVRLDQRVPKKLLLEQGAPTAADKRAIQDGLEELTWVAALKPANIGVAAYKDEVREYLEIAVLTAVLRPTAKTTRLTELIHRAIPYPLVLITEQGGRPAISLAHKRRSQAQNEAVVLDGKLNICVLSAEALHEAEFVTSLALAGQAAHNLNTVYQGWLDCMTAFAAAQITDRFVRAGSVQQIADRDKALDEHTRLQQERINLRAQAVREKQINRRADLNMQIHKLDNQLANLLNKL